MRKSAFLMISVLFVFICLGVYLALRNKPGRFSAKPAKVAAVETAGLVSQEEKKPILKQTMGEISPNPRSSDLPEDEKLICNEHEIEIPKTMLAALNKWDAGFVLWKSREYDYALCIKVATSPVLALNAGLGDFNGDGKQDVVVAGHNKQIELLVAVLSQKAGDYKVVPLCSSEVIKKVPLETESCKLLGTLHQDLKQFPRAAIYRVLPEGTKINVTIGHSDPYISSLKSEAFIAGLSQDFSGPQHDYENPFMAVQLFYWNWDFRDGTSKEWEWLNTTKDFISWDIYSIDDNHWEFSNLIIGC